MRGPLEGSRRGAPSGLHNDRPAPAGRFAPSPTGDLHIGNLRTALLAWLHARRAGDRFLIRIEDLDVGRVRESFVESQLADLRAIGLESDRPPVRQSRRAELYRAALGRLEGEERVYRCFCTRREIREAASAHHGDPGGRYPGTCRELGAREADRRAAAGDPFALRLRAEGASVTVEDRRHGRLSRPVDDLVLVRRDGVFAYNLAVVVDDADQTIAEVVRGDDLLASTPDQAMIHDLLGLGRPRFSHVPLVLGADGQRLAKRHGSVTRASLIALGWGDEALLGFLGRSIGLLEPGEPPSLGTLLERFEPTELPPDPLVLPQGWPSGSASCV